MDETSKLLDGNITQKFYISRHLRSCNNIIDDKDLSTLRKFAEPALSLWGTLTGLSLERNIEGTFYNKVYVSCLVRTWMTAIIQYLPYCSNNKIYLIVSPYIKEKHNKLLKQADLGNLPVNFSEQIKKLQQYFDFLTIINLFLNDSIKNDYKISNSSVTQQIKEHLNKVLTENTEIFIDFPTEKKSFKLNYKNKKLNLLTPIDKNFNPYSKNVPRVNDYSLMRGGFKFGPRETEYMKKNFISLIDQKASKIKIQDVKFSDPPFPLKINKIDTSKKGMFYKTQPRINIFTDYFEKEGMFLFINWVQNEVKDNSKDIYVVAHSNIMQATLVNICQLITDNKNLNKKMLKACHNDFAKIQKQNIWELVLEIKSNNNLMYLNSLVVREGEDPPNITSTNNIDLNQELSCFRQELSGAQECTPNKLINMMNQLNNPNIKADEIQEIKREMQMNYQKCCPKTSLGYKSTTPYCKQLESNIKTSFETEQFSREYNVNEPHGFTPIEAHELRKEDLKQEKKSNNWFFSRKKGGKRKTRKTTRGKKTRKNRKN